MAAQSAAPIQTFTIGFDTPDYDERDLARRVAVQCGTQHLERVVVPEDLETGLERLGAAFDEPFGDASALATHVVAGVARERVTVVLTGDGGDELLAGYTRYQGEKFSQSYAALPRVARQVILPGVVQALATLAPGRLRDRAQRAARVLAAANLDFESRLARKQSWSDPELRTELLALPAAAVRPAREYIGDAMRDCPAHDPFHRLNWFDYTFMLPSQMLTKVDRMSMAHSLEARVPFLDHRLVELMATVSARVQMPGYTRKHVLRKALGARLPLELLRAPKRGFNVPMREWFRGGDPLQLLQRQVAGGSLDGLVRPSQLTALLEAHRARRADHGQLLWILLQLASWRGRAEITTRRA
jgi:asparagine synthase (glutamine-hydrolysing)